MESLSAGATLRALLAVVMLVGFYIVGFGLLAALVLASVLLWTVMPGETAHSVAWLTALSAVALVVPLWQITRPGVRAADGVLVGEQDAEPLWALVREVADLVGTRAPDEIRLTADMNAGVVEEAGLVGLRRGHRCLYLGAPLLRALTVTQLRAVLAHEMGHYGHGHTVFGAVVYRGGRSMRATIARTGPRRVGGLLLTVYAALYFVVALTVMRRMEREADAASVRAAGTAATREALAAMPGLDRAWSATIRRYADITQHSVLSPQDVLDLFASVPRLPEVDLAEAGSWWDSHPSIAERLAALPIEGPDPLTPVDTRPADVLITDRGLRCAALETEVFAAMVESAAAQADDLDAEEVYTATVKILLSRRGGLGGVLDVLTAGRGVALVAALPLSVSRIDQTDPAVLLVDRVCATIRAHLIDTRTAAWAHAWSEPMILRDADTRPVRFRSLVVDACADPVAVAALRTHLRALGIDEAIASAWSDPGRSAFDDATGVGSAAPTIRLLPDELLRLARHKRGHRISSDILNAGLAAGAIAELRLARRIELRDGDAATVHVVDSTPTGDGFLDSVLSRIAAAEEYPAYRWLLLIGSDIREAAESRDRRYARSWLNTDARASIVAALDAGDLDNRPALLGKLLWGVELTRPVLGRRAVATRFWLGRGAAQDPLMMAIRVVTGIHMPAPATTTYGQ